MTPRPGLRRKATKARCRQPPEAGRARRIRIWPTTTAVAVGLTMAGCAAAPLEQTGLSSYSDLEKSDGMLTHSLVHVSKPDVLAAKTVKIVPTVFSGSAAASKLTEKQRKLVANAVDRTLCARLSERFEVVGPSAPADLVVRAAVTHIVPTNAAAAGVSKGASVATSILLPGVPVPIPRIPIGLGSLSLEAEAVGPTGNQVAAMVWGRGANAFFGAARVAEEGDAYGLAAEFGADFGDLVVTGASPFGKFPSLPPMERVGALLGGAPKYPACAAFGKSPGIVGMVGEGLGAPPDWTDKGADAGAPAAAAAQPAQPSASLTRLEPQG